MNISIRTALGTLCLSVMCLAQVKPAPTVDSPLMNLPAHRIGPNDLLSVSVYDAPELSKSVRVSADGYIRLPMLKGRLYVAGVLPLQVEQTVTEALQKEEILVSPIVTVGISEYSSRPINVAGAVRQPQVFQAIGPVNLLDAISKAGGLTDLAGKEILVTDKSKEQKRIPVKGLFEGGDASLNLSLSGGEEIRVLEAGKAFVVGTVKKPGAFVLHDAEESTVLQMLALAEGLMPFASKQAYIYRREQDGSRKEVAVQLDDILRRKHPDVAVLPEDILYIPESRGRKLTSTAIERALAFGSAGASALIYTTAR